MIICHILPAIPHGNRKRLPQTLWASRGISVDPPSWYGFTNALKQSKGKALQWHLYIAVRHVGRVVLFSLHGSKRTSPSIQV